MPCVEVAMVLLIAFLIKDKLRSTYASTDELPFCWNSSFVDQLAGYTEGSYRTSKLLRTP
jgi:hypothetical protein